MRTLLGGNNPHRPRVCVRAHDQMVAKGGRGVAADLWDLVRIHLVHDKVCEQPHCPVHLMMARAEVARSTAQGMLS